MTCGRRHHSVEDTMMMVYFLYCALDYVGQRFHAS